MKQVSAPIDCIDPNPYQPSSARNEEKVLEIANSIEQNFDTGIGTQGLNQVPTARQVGDRYQLAFGHHRHQAFARLAGEGKDIFSKMPLIIEDLTDQQMFEAMATENLQRREISFIEEAEMFHSYMEIFGKNSVETAQRFQKTEEHVRGRIMFLQLPEAAKEKAKAGELNVTTARALVSVEKVGGEKLVERALKEMEKKGYHDTPQDAVEYVLANTQGVTRLSITADWAQANKNFPKKHLPKLSQEDLNHVLEVSSDSQSRLAREILQFIHDGFQLTFDDQTYPSFRPENLVKVRVLINPPACTKCPFHTAIEGSDFCGIGLCKERKEAAWEQKKLEETANTLGVPLYQKSEGRYVQLNPYDAADKKLWNEGVADLRLAPASYMWNNFEGVGMNLKVVVVGETAEKRLKAEEKSRTKANDEQIGRQQREKIDETTEQFQLRFGWEVASHAFGVSLDGLSAPLMDFMISELLEWVVQDVVFPEGSDDHDELIEAARKMKKADGLKEMRRIMIYDMLYAKHFNIFDGGAVGVVALAKDMQKTATEWGIKLPKDWMKQAETYQSELDAALKELTTHAARPARSAGEPAAKKVKA